VPRDSGIWGTVARYHEPLMPRRPVRRTAADQQQADQQQADQQQADQQREQEVAR
jgi:hypothetical protein